jgi:hypothetical protein
MALPATNHPACLVVIKVAHRKKNARKTAAINALQVTINN